MRYVTTGTAISTRFLSESDDNLPMQSFTRGSNSRVLMWLRVTLGFVGRLGFSRHGALVATRRMFPAKALSPTRKALSLLIASSCIGVGVVLLTEADLGLSPYDVLVSGLMPRVGLSFGQTVWLVAAVLFSIAAVLGQRPSRWGIAYVLANGIAIDAISGTINSPESMAGRISFVAAALVVIAAGISLVVHSGSTGGAFELLTTAGEERGLDRVVVRTSLEVGLLVLGIFLGGRFGPATIAIALGIGPVIGLLSQALADHANGRTWRLIETAPEKRHPSAMAGRTA